MKKNIKNRGSLWQNINYSIAIIIFILLNSAIIALELDDYERLIIKFIIFVEPLLLVFFIIIIWKKYGGILPNSCNSSGGCKFGLWVIYTTNLVIIGSIVLTIIVSFQFRGGGSGIPLALALMISYIPYIISIIIIESSRYLTKINENIKQSNNKINKDNLLSGQNPPTE